MSATSDSVDPAQSSERLQLIHRELLQLVALVVVAVIGFFVTKTVADSNRAMTLRDAAEWYRRGQAAFDRGNYPDAIDALRRATIRDRGERRYVLALAQALALAHETEAARTALIGLRETAPEDPVVNLALARLADQRNDITEAVRFYHSALYAPWPPNLEHQRRKVRLELVHALLTHKQTGRAVAELMVVSSEPSDEVEERVELADLFVQAGDQAHALAAYERALELAPNDSRALAGAGQSAFQLGDYRRARLYLHRLNPQSGPDAFTRAVVDFVLSNDPFAARLGAAERRRRLRADLAYVEQRLRACRPKGQSGTIDLADMKLQSELAALSHTIASTSRLEQDTVEGAMDVIDGLARRVMRDCGPPTAADQALVIIGRRHRGDPS